MQKSNACLHAGLHAQAVNGGISMENIVTRIIEIDREANEKLAKSKQQQQQLLADARAEAQQQQEELEKRADNRISQVELYHEGEYRRISQELSEKFDAAVMALNKSFEERHEQIETEIFNRIVGE